MSIKHKIFRWVVDDEGDIGLQILGLITLIKYKDSTIVELGRTRYPKAPKYMGA